MIKIRKVMKTNKLMMSATAFLLLLAGVGCGNRTTKAESTAAAAETAVGEALQIDDLLAEGWTTDEIEELMYCG